ncbi:MAG TPA: hypothetical protein DEO84_03065 [candidate division Zixibacteria bacterium]|nr:hypothetical protein [candidate division Zixibacteria bacterium]
MRALKTLILMAAVFSAALCQAGGLTKAVSVNDFFMSKSLSMQSYLSKALDVKTEGGDLRDDIYEFHSKSPSKAFFMSLIIPGAGQYYNGSKIKAGSFLGVDALLWAGYLIYHGKGVTREKDYKTFADQHYLSSVFFNWWDGLDTSVTNVFSHRIYQDSSGNPLRTREYYENIGKYDQFQVGWDDIGINIPPPGTPGGNPNSGTISEHRGAYLNMRKQSNDYFANAKTLAMVSIGNHLVSAFEAAIGARRFNRSGKQYSLNIESRNINGRIVPFAMVNTIF